jgi:hypothetical protein
VAVASKPTIKFILTCQGSASITPNENDLCQNIFRVSRSGRKLFGGGIYHVGVMVRSCYVDSESSACVSMVMSALLTLTCCLNLGSIRTPSA